MGHKQEDPLARLLIVEDEPLVADDLRLRLEELGYAVAGVADNASDALRLVQEHGVDLVLMDIVLKGDVDGIEVAATIHRLHGIPVIFVTAYTDSDLLERAGSIEPFGYVVKPVRTRELHATVSMALYRARLEHQLEGMRWAAGICNHLSDAIIAINGEGHIVYMNPAANRLLGGTGNLPAADGWQKGLLSAEADNPLDINRRIRHVFDTGRRESFDEDFHLHNRESRKVIRLQLIPIPGMKSRKEPVGVAVVLEDVTDQRIAQAALQRVETALRLLHEITSDQTLDFEQKIRRLLGMGAEQFALPIATLAQIDGDEYHIIDSVSPDGMPRPGEVFSLAGTFCGSTLETDGPLGLSDTGNTQWRRHSAGEKSAVGSYLGIPVRIAGQVYGTLNYSSRQARSDQFSSDDFEILKLMSQWLGSELDRRRIYMNLESEKRRAATLSQISPQGVFRTDVSGSCTYVNTRWCEITGLSKDQALGAGWSAFLDSDNQASIAKQWHNALQYKMDFNRQCHFRRAGKDSWLLVRMAAEQDSDGNIAGYVGSLSDISDLKETQDALLERKQAYSDLLANLTGMAYRYSNDDNRTLTYVSEGCEKLTGWSVQELGNSANVALSELVHPGDQEWLGDSREESFAARQPSSTEYRIITRGGETRWVWDQSSGCYDDNGHLVEVQGFVSDITSRKSAEEQFARHKAQFEAVFNTIPDAIVYTDTDREILAVNPAVQTIFGYKPEELLGHSTEILYADTASYREQGERRFNPDAVPDTRPYQMRYRCKDGKEFLGETTGVVVRGAAGDVVGMLGVIRDITEREEAARKTYQALQHLKALYNASPDMVFMHDARGRIVEVNQAALRTYGYRSEEMLSLTIEDLSGQGYTQAMAQDAIEKAMRGEDADFDWMAKRKDGQEFPVEVRLRRLEGLHGREGPPLVAVVRDLSDRVLAEKVLKQERGFSTTILDTIGSVVVVLSRSGQIVRFNKAARRVSGYSEDEVLGRCVWDFLLPKNERAGVKQVFARLTAGDFPNNYENNWLSKDNELRMLQWSNSALTDARDEVEYVIATGIDITQQRKIEAELRQHHDNLEHLVQQRTAALEHANSELEAFSYSVSHDLRAPLRGIDGFSQTLLEEYSDKIDAVGQDYLKRVRRASQRLGVLIDDLLELSRVGRNVLEYRWVDVSKIAVAVLKELQNSEPEQKLKADIQPGMEACGDLVSLRLLMQNLLGNAWKFSSVRNVSEIRFAMHEDDSGRRVFFVSDNGAGFDMSYAGKLFGAFQRLHSGQEFEGTGIGLATVQRIVHRHEGEIWAESKVNEGATFYFTLSDEHCR